MIVLKVTKQCEGEKPKALFWFFIGNDCDRECEAILKELHDQKLDLMRPGARHIKLVEPAPWESGKRPVPNRYTNAGIRLAFTKKPYSLKIKITNLNTKKKMKNIFDKILAH